MKSKSRYTDNLKDLVAEYWIYSTQESKLRKRGILNFVGEISKILFGTLTQSDARNYNKHITELEKEFPMQLQNLFLPSQVTSKFSAHSSIP
jgi:hypothetical protein